MSLGIGIHNSTSHTLTVKLITLKLTKGQRPVVDFCLLNTRILCRNTSIPLISDFLSILGNSKCKVCLTLNLKMHTIVYALLRKLRNIVVYFLILGVPFTGMRCYEWALHVAFKYEWTMSL